MKRLITVLLIALTASLSALTVTGYVVDEARKPLDSVYISIGKRVVQTDNTGRFSLENVTPQDEVTFHRAGYQTLNLTISQLLNDNMVTLKKEPFQIDGAKIKSSREKLELKTPEKVLIEIDNGANVHDLSDLLKAVPEVRIVGTELAGEKKTVAILGHNPRHTLVLLDGIPMNSRGQSFDIGSIPVDTIESVEIIKGASPSGSGALGGVISIRTKKSNSRLEYGLSQSVGSFESYKTAASLKYRQKYYSLSLFAETNKAKNNFTYLDRAGAKKERGYNDKASQNLQLRLTALISPQFNATYQLDLQNFDHKLPGPVNYEAHYRDARLEGYAANQSLLMSLYWLDTNFDLTLYQHQQRSDYDNTRAPFPFYHLKSKHLRNKKGALLKSDKEYDNLALETNLEFQREDLSYTESKNVKNNIPLKAFDNYALSGEIKYLLPIKEFDLTQTLVLREDYSKEWKDNLSYGYDVALHYYYPLELAIGGGLSRNFSFPSFYDLYWKGDFQTTGNPDLKPENAFHEKLFAELGYSQLKFKVEYHQSKVDNLIYWYRSILGWKPGNIARASIDNLSLKGEYTIGKYADISATYLTTKAINRSLKPDGSHSDLYGKKLIYTPEETFQADLHLHYSYYSLRLSHRFTGRQWSTLDQLISPLKEYQLTDLELGVGVPFKKQNYRVSLLLNNIFNHHYEIYAYTPQPGFNWLLNLQYNYKK